MYFLRHPEQLDNKLRKWLLRGRGKRAKLILININMCYFLFNYNALYFKYISYQYNCESIYIASRNPWRRALVIEVLLLPQFFSIIPDIQKGSLNGSLSPCTIILHFLLDRSVLSWIPYTWSSVRSFMLTGRRETLSIVSYYVAKSISAWTPSRYREL